MKTILQENDKRYGRRNFEKLLSGRRPTGRFNPYKCPNPNVLTVPYWRWTVYPVNMLVDRAYNEGETDSGDETDEIDGLDRRPPGLPDYVVKRRRLAHYVHHVTKKKLSKAYTCSFWNVRPYLGEQLTYAHMDAICIILMLQRCTKMPGGRMALQDWLGEAALAEIDLDNVDN